MTDTKVINFKTNTTMQHSITATGQTGKQVDATDEKILLEIPGERYSDQPNLQWFDKNELELPNLQQPEVAKQPQKLPAIVKEKKPAVKKKVVNKKISK